MQNIMILGANILQVPLINQAVESGYGTIVVSPQKEEPGFKHATYSVFADVADKETVLSYAQKYNIIGIITDQTDIPVRTAAYVAEKMGLPGIGYDTACLFTDKFLMREKCKELGIATLKYKKVTNVAEALDFFETLNGPAIIKPIDNQGSKGVSKVTNKDELITKFEEAITYSKEKAVLIEQYVTGREFVVDGLAYNYEFQNLICGDPHYFDIPNVFSSAKIEFPSRAEAKLVNRVKELNKRIITGFGLKQGRTHSEFIMDANEIYLIETAARGGGVFISSDLVSLTTGLNNEEILVNIAAGKQEGMPVISNTNLFCCYIAFYMPIGEIISLEGVVEVMAFPFTHRHSFDTLRIGLKTKPYTDKTARNFIIVSGNNREQLIKNVEEVRTTLNIKVETETGIKGLIWS